jgi:hypothetical protein
MTGSIPSCCGPSLVFGRVTFESSALSTGWSPCPAAVAEPTDIAGVPVEEELESGPKVVPAPLAEFREDWFWEADIVEADCY